MPLRVAVVGGGPGGLTFAALAAADGHEVTVHEQRADSTVGVGVTLWPDHLAQLRQHAPQLVDRIVECSLPWHDQVFAVGDHEPIRTDGSGYGTDRTALLAVLADHAERMGARLQRGHRIERAEEVEDADLVVAADGAGSLLRDADRAGFGTTVRTDGNRYAWLRLDRPLDAFWFHFAKVSSGWVWAYAYPHRRGDSTVVVELTDDTWRNLGFDAAGAPTVVARLQSLFADRLDGGSLGLLPGADPDALWSRFRLVRNRAWHRGRTVLLGDAAHTTHFSVGSGTRLAMEDAAVLAAALDADRPLERALQEYSAQRIDGVRPTVVAAERSTRFFEALPRFIERPPRDFVRLLEHRRSRLLHGLPVPAFLTVSRGRDRLQGRTLPY